MKSRIVLVDDHALIREGIRCLLEREPDLEVVAEGNNGLEAEVLAGAFNPHLVMMDVAMPRLNGIDAIGRVLAVAPHTRILCLSMHTDSAVVERALVAGAHGYVPKNAVSEELVLAIKVLRNNQNYLSPRITECVVRIFKDKSKKNGSSLFTREREVLQRLAEGQATKVIAGELSVCIKTIETHRRNIMRKLNSNSIAELTKYALLHGLTSLEA
jgi:DNA-binding NarL/FixJ family response regulator